MNGKYDDLTAEEIIKLLVGSGEEIKKEGEVNSDKAPKINGQALCKDLNLSKQQLRTVLTVAMMAQASEFAVQFKKMAAERRNK